MNKVISYGQRFSEQDRDSIPEHPGSKHSRVRVCVPPPHVTVHSFHIDQSKYTTFCTPHRMQIRKGVFLQKALATLKRKKARLSALSACKALRAPRKYFYYCEFSKAYFFCVNTTFVCLVSTKSASNPAHQIKFNVKTDFLC